MNPDLLLAIVGLCAAFALRTTLAFGVCLILSRLVSAANHRFILWAGFLYGSATYWLYLAGTLILDRQLPTRRAMELSLPTRAAAASWNIPQSWAFSLSIAFGVLGAVYGVVLAYNLISHANKLRHLRWVMGFATAPPAEISCTLQALTKSLRMRPPQLRMLSGATSPATFGWLRPVILLPTLCIGEDSSDLEDMLLHELHHVRRWDSFWNALAIAARAVVCFHPAAWYAMRKMRFDRELACDFAVVSRSPSRKGMYAESLLRFARLHLAQEPASWGIDFAASSDHLKVRVHSILTEARKSSPWLHWLRVGSGLVLLATFAGVMPSLAIVFGYTHASMPATVSANLVPSVNALNAARAVRRPRAMATPTAATASVPASGLQEATLPKTDENAIEAEAPQATELPAGPGPHLQRRVAGTAAANSATRQQSIPLIDPSDSGQTGKHGDTGETVQQSATVAAAIWKRVGDLDRH